MQGWGCSSGSGVQFRCEGSSLEELGLRARHHDGESGSSRFCVRERGGAADRRSAVGALNQLVQLRDRALACLLYTSDAADDM
eukprot:1292771-Rhodomonas_salina.7